MSCSANFDCECRLLLRCTQPIRQLVINCFSSITIPAKFTTCFQLCIFRCSRTRRVDVAVPAEVCAAFDSWFAVRRPSDRRSESHCSKCSRIRSNPTKFEQSTTTTVAASSTAAVEQCRRSKHSVKLRCGWSCKPARIWRANGPVESPDLRSARL